MKRYRVEFRAEPDTPLEEERARSQGRVLTPQTVIYPSVPASGPDEAVKSAWESEWSFPYRRLVGTSGFTRIRLFEAPILIVDDGAPAPPLTLPFVMQASRSGLRTNLNVVFGGIEDK